MKLSDGLYFWLKYLCIIVLPALSTLIIILSKIWGWDPTGQLIADTVTAIATFLGTILCISNYNYNRRK